MWATTMGAPDLGFQVAYCVDSAIYTCRQRVQTACRQRADSVQTARADSAADGVNAKWVIAYILHNSKRIHK